MLNATPVYMNAYDEVRRGSTMDHDHIKPTSASIKMTGIRSYCTVSSVIIFVIFYEE